MARLGSKDLAVELLRSVKVARLVILYGEVEHGRRIHASCPRRKKMVCSDRNILIFFILLQHISLRSNSGRK
jgi:hypothetical protein